MITAFFLAFGGGYLALGVALRPWGLPLAWLGLSFLVVGLAYLRDAPGLLGKRGDGTFHPAGALACAPFLLLAWLSWEARRRRSEPCWNEIAPGLFLGRLALPAEVPSGDPLIVDLTCELAEPRALRRRYRCLPTLDGRAPERGRFVALTHELATLPGPVFVHCAAGHGRSAALVCALLLARGVATDVGEAVRRLKQRRPGVALTRAQLRLLHAVAPELTAARHSPAPQ